MKGLIDTIRNIYKIEDLRLRILTTLGLILIYRIGSFIVLPGIDPTGLDALTSQGQSGIPGLINMFAGGAFSRASIFALGIMPYISASIIVQLLGITIPYFQKLQKEGESGRRRINQMTRYLTVLITGGQASAYVNYLKYTVGSAIVSDINPALFWLTILVVLTAGTMFVMWIGEKITDKGIGNGISLIIMIGIIAQLPFGLSAEFVSRYNEPGGLIPFLFEIFLLVVIIGSVILLVQGTRRIPVQYAKRVVGNKMYGGARQYIPFKVNAAGVMPIIFAQAIMFIPGSIMQFIPDSFESVQGMALAFVNPGSVLYNCTLAFFVIVFTYFYTAILYNPIQMADEMKRNGAFIPGVKPGKKTAEFLDSVMSRITFPGSLFLALVTILPAFAMAFGINNQFASFYGGTSLLILVGVVLDTLQQIESHLLMRHYDGLMKSGRIKGRSSVAAPSM